MRLRNLNLKEQYRSDRDDIISEFFLPCLTNCIQYDRAIEFTTMKSLSTLSLGFENSGKNSTKIRMITGHNFSIGDLNTLVKLFSKNGNGKLNFSNEFIRDAKIIKLKQIVNTGYLQMKIAIPNSEEVDGKFAEKIGIFRDEYDDMIAFSGTSNVTFDNQNRNFESIDVFTSWDDQNRVKTKAVDFENLWNDSTKSVQVYDFEFAEKNNLLKYSPEWAAGLN